jgi:hypothetical protein
MAKRQSANYTKTFETEIISGTKNIHELEIYKTNTTLNLSSVIRKDLLSDSKITANFLWIWFQC